MTTGKPDYEELIDCQWDCPARTPVPEYIRHIARGEHLQAWILNRMSNLMPGILGRVCDRPCEPACRRGRLEGEEPVAICRLKRFATDRSDAGQKAAFEASLHEGAVPLGEKKVALIGTGPASLSAAFELDQRGYACHLFDKDASPGGAMRTAIPRFRLPRQVLDEEISALLGPRIQCTTGHEVQSIQALLDDGFAAVFVGTGAGRPAVPNIPGDPGPPFVQPALDFLRRAIESDDPAPLTGDVLVIGGGNTAMDCSRMALRLGAASVRVVMPESRKAMSASPWEVEEAEDEGVLLEPGLLPRRMEGSDAGAGTVWFQPLSASHDTDGRFNPVPSGEEERRMSCHLVIYATGQKPGWGFVDESLGIRFTNGLPDLLPDSLRSRDHPAVFFGGDCARGPSNIISAVANGRQAAEEIDAWLQKKKVRKGPDPHWEWQRMGLHSWRFSNQVSLAGRGVIPREDLQRSLGEGALEVEQGFTEAGACREAERCLNCDVQTVFQREACIECDACVDVCPVDCLVIAPDVPSGSALMKQAPERGPVVASEPLPQTQRLMIKDEDVCLRCSLCAERCPTGAWDLQKLVTAAARLPGAERTGSDG